MIFRKLTALALKSKFMYPFSYASKNNYEHFFQQIQKSSRAQQAIRLYKNVQNEGVILSNYLTVTLRILTRILNNDNMEDRDKINKFIVQNLNSLKTIQSSQLVIEQRKDVLLFLLHYTHINFGLIPQNISNFIERNVRAYIDVFSRFSDEEKKHSVQILISSLKPIFYFYNEFMAQYLNQIMKIFIKHKKEFIMDNLSFKCTIQAFSYTFTATNNLQRQFLQEVAQYILKQNIIGNLENDTLAAILSAYYTAKTKLIKLNLNVQKIDDLINAVDNYILGKINTINGRDIELIAKVHLQHNAQSSFISQYYSIIALSINQKGSTCLNPLFILQSLSLLNYSYIHLITDNNKQWQQNFIAFLLKQFHNQHRYVRVNDDFIYLICEKQLLKHQIHQKLVKFYAQTYRNKKITPVVEFKKKLNQINLYAHSLQTHKINGSIKSINESFLNKLPQYRIMQSPTLAFLDIQSNTSQNKKQIKFNDQNRLRLKSSDITPQLVLRIFALQLKIFTFGLSKQKIPEFLQFWKLSFKFDEKSRRQFTKIIIYSLKIPLSLYELSIKVIKQLYNSIGEFENEAYSLLLQKISCNQPLNYENIGFLHFIYQQYFPQAYNKLLFVCDSLFPQLYSANKKIINQYIFGILYKQPSLLTKYLPVLYQSLSYYNSHCFTEFESQQFLVMIAKIKNDNFPRQFVQLLYQFCLMKSLFKNNKNIKIMQNIKSKHIYFSNKQVLQLEQEYLYNASQNYRAIYSNILIDNNQTAINFGLQIRNILQYNILCNYLRKMLSSSNQLLLQIETISTITNNLLKYVQTFSSSQQLSLYSLLIENRIYSKKIEQSILKLQKNHLVSQSNILALLSKCPSQKQQAILLRMIQEFFISEQQMLEYWLAVYTLIVSPSNKIIRFTDALIKKHPQKIPLYFHLYRNLDVVKLSEFVKYKLREGRVEIIQVATQQIFEGTKIALNDYYCIQTRKMIQSCGKIIIKKILQTHFPNRAIVFHKAKANSRQKFFKPK